MRRVTAVPREGFEGAPLLRRSLLLCGIVAVYWFTACASLLGFEDDRLADPDLDTAGGGARAGAPAKGGEQARGGAAGSYGGAGQGGTSSPLRAGSSGTGGEVLVGGAGSTNGAPGGADGGAGEPAIAGGCAGHAGPKMIRVGAFCIDETEVTLRQFREFWLAHVDPHSVASCEWKESFADLPVDANSFDMPVGFVDWCDAKAYCEWAGKRLCGKIGGGALPTDTIYTADANRDEWYRTCSDAGARRYVYGDSYDAQICNSAANQMSSVGSHPECTTKEGVFDILGNVWEWQNACDEAGSTNPAQVKCGHRGGSSFFGDIDCAALASQARSFTAPDLGFRCCSD